jgi:hypothetical protein
MSDNDDPQLPLGEALLHCLCGYESPPFFFADNTYGCRTCRAVVFPEPVPFLYTPPKCPHCDRQLTPQDRIPASRMWADISVRCPHCESESLKLRDLRLQLLASQVCDSVPVVGQLIHAQTRQPERRGELFLFVSPRLAMQLALHVSVANRDAGSIPNGHHEFRTVQVAERQLVVDYLRQLPETEWRWYVWGPLQPRHH